MKVQTSPYERAVNALAKTDPKLADKLEKACYRDMKKDREAAAKLAAAQQDNERLREALQDMAEVAHADSRDPAGNLLSRTMGQIWESKARAALASSQGEK